MNLDRIIHYKDDDTEAVFCVYDTRTDCVYFQGTDNMFEVMNYVLYKIEDDSRVKIIRDTTNMAKYLLKYSGGKIVGSLIEPGDPEYEP